MGKPAIIATLKAAEGKADELEKVLQGMFAQVDKEPGTIIYALSKKDDEPGTFVFFELYTDGDAVQAHSTSDAMKEFGGKLGGLLGGRPEIVRLELIGGKGV